MTGDYYNEGYEKLAAAVVEQAVTDYRNALKRHYRHPLDTEAIRIINDCERFFHNEIEIYSELDGQAIMRAIKEKVGEEIRNEQRKAEAL